MALLMGKGDLYPFSGLFEELYRKIKGGCEA
jgi:hypothetical protein